MIRLEAYGVAYDWDRERQAWAPVNPERGAITVEAVLNVETRTLEPPPLSYVPDLDLWRAHQLMALIPGASLTVRDEEPEPLAPGEVY